MALSRLLVPGGRIGVGFGWLTHYNCGYFHHFQCPHIHYSVCSCTFSGVVSIRPLFSSLSSSGRGKCIGLVGEERHFHMDFIISIYGFIHCDISRRMDNLTWSFWSLSNDADDPGVQFYLQLQILVTLTFSPLCYTIIVRLSYDNHVRNETPRVNY